MFLKFKKINNESGVVLFFVLMVAIIIMIFSLGILTQSMNEINYAQQQIDQITASQWSKGLIWNSYASGSLPSGGLTAPMNGRNYTATFINTPGATENTWQASVTYDSFQ